MSILSSNGVFVSRGGIIKLHFAAKMPNPVKSFSLQQKVYIVKTFYKQNEDISKVVDGLKRLHNIALTTESNIKVCLHSVLSRSCLEYPILGAENS